MLSTKGNDTARCPACLMKLDGATDPEGESAPSEGAMSVCCYCSNIGVFNKDLTIRSMSIKDWGALPEAVKTHVEEYQRRVQRWTKTSQRSAPPALPSPKEKPE